MQPQRKLPTGTISSLALERVLPNSKEAEMAVVGSMLLSPIDAAAVVRAVLDEQHFYYAAHQVIFREFCVLQDSLTAVDAVTLGQWLRGRKLLDEIGGDVYLTDLVHRVPTTSNIAHYIDIVLEQHVRRRSIALAHELMQKAFEDEDLAVWLPAMQQQMFEVDLRAGDQRVIPFREHIRNSMARIEQWQQTPGLLNGLSTGLRDVDAILGGLKPADMVILAGRPGMGKSTLAMDIGSHNALAGNAVGIFSLEMTAEQLSDRTLCGHAHVNLRRLQHGQIEVRDYPALTTAASALAQANILIDDSPDLTIAQIRSRARRMKHTDDIKLVIIDYVQLARPTKDHRGNREGEVAEVSRGCKALAKELRIPVIAVAQLNRLADAGDQRPRLSWLRESGQLEQDADVVGILVRPEVYEEDPEAREQLRGRATLSVVKQRGGPVGDIELTFLAEFTRFQDAARISDEDIPRRTGEE